ncbi:alpha-2-macroglobulin family protein [Methylotuvimicrobium alcaliphilum]|uniref:Uncharacterized protein n=1 Tax=Methylotuvimicrobium alcaliphilum (strain DSM 19304 / NCIMB 14124 / VKM B-2133 / 20Z) TaxID=1091494 RepID=G4T1Z2_META2|nr:hypothetical protein [Methylotuvimicrobium alcaliphilum]CCE24666.1 protein of unknown function [Methylotuvimicrobium alcaliphilum 20Z]
MSKKFAPITYQLRSGSYSIDNLRFRPGDKLIYSSGIAVAIENNAPNDGFINVVSIFNRIESWVRLKVPRDKDGPVTDIASFNEVFGPGSLTFDPAITQAQAKGKTVTLQGNAGPGIDSVAIFTEGAETTLGFASVTNGIWFFTIPELEVGTHTFFARGVFPDGELGEDSLVKEVTVLELIPLTFTPNHSEIFELPGTLNTVTYTISGRAGTTLQLALSPDSEASEDDVSITGLSDDNQLTLGVNGTATFSVTALQDNETEISELLRFLVSDVDDPSNNVTADVTIRDFLPLTLTPSLTEIFEQPEAPNTVLYTITGLPGTRVQLAITEDSIADANDILSTNLPYDNQLVLNDQGLATFSVTARQDDLPELAELLRVSVFDLDNPTNNTSADVTIFDVTPLSISTDRSTIFEQPGLPDTVVYTITGTPGLTVRLAIAQDSVADAADILSTHLPDNNLLTLNDSGTATFSVTARQDDTPEFDELLRVSVTEIDNPTSVAFADVTIRDLTQLTITPDQLRIYEQPGAPNTATYTITGSPGAAVQLAIAPDSVADTDDILTTNLPDNNLLTLNDDGIAIFSVTARQDDITELDELLRISVTDILNQNNTAIADVTISDTTPLSITPNRTEIYEQPGLPDTVTYTIIGAPGATVQWAIAEDSVADADDILSTNLPDNNQLVLNDQGLATFSVTARQEDLTEPSELLRVVVFDLDHPSNSASADVTIFDLTPLSISADRSSIFEQPGLPDTVTYTIVGSPGATVQLAIAEDSVADADDILGGALLNNTPLVLNAQGLATFSVTARQDDLTEPGELFRVVVFDLDHPSNSASADITISDFTPLTLTPDRSRIYEQPGVPNTVTYTIAGTPGATVQLAIAEGSTADADDILSTHLQDNNLLTLNDDGIATFSVTARQDYIAEIDELLRVSVTDIDNPNDTATAEVTISDITPLSITRNRTQIYEQPGTPNTVTYRITGTPGTEVQLEIPSNSVAKADDISSAHLPNNNRLTLDANGVATFSVTAVQDDLVEGNELFRVLVRDVEHRNNTASVSITIRDYMELTITPDRTEIHELPGSPNTVTYTVTGLSGSDISISRYGEASSADGQDFELSAVTVGTLIGDSEAPDTFIIQLNANGEARFVIIAVQDFISEDPETLVLRASELNNPNNVALSATLLIQDTDPFRLTVNNDNLTGTDNNNEFDGSLFFSDLNDGLATLNTGDVVDGGLGFDTLEADLLAGTVAPTLISIEEIILWGEEGSVFDISHSSDIEEIKAYGEENLVTITATDSTTFNEITLSGAIHLDLTGDYSPLSDAHLQIWGDLWVNSSSKQVIDLSNQNDDLYIEFRYSSADELTLPISVESEDFYGVVLSYTNATYSAPISITNFTVDRDLIIFDQTRDSSFFAALPDGNLTEYYIEGNFGSDIPDLGDDASDIYLIYDLDSGKLYYDADEGGAGAPVEILQLIGAPTLSADDLELWWGL